MRLTTDVFVCVRGWRALGVLAITATRRLARTGHPLLRCLRRSSVRTQANRRCDAHPHSRSRGTARAVAPLRPGKPQPSAQPAAASVSSCGPCNSTRTALHARLHSGGGVLQVRDEVVAVALLLEAGEDHLGALDVLLGVLEVLEEGVLAPGHACGKRAGGGGNQPAANGRPSVRGGRAARKRAGCERGGRAPALPSRALPRPGRGGRAAATGQRWPCSRAQCCRGGMVVGAQLPSAGRNGSGGLSSSVGRKQLRSPEVLLAVE